MPFVKRRRRSTNREFRRFTYKACTAFLSMLTVRVVVLEYNQLHKKVNLEALKMYCVMRASVPSLYNVYRRYDKSFLEMKGDRNVNHHNKCNKKLPCAVVMNDHIVSPSRPISF